MDPQGKLDEDFEYRLQFVPASKNHVFFHENNSFLMKMGSRASKIPYFLLKIFNNREINFRDNMVGHTS